MILISHMAIKIQEQNAWIHHSHVWVPYSNYYVKEGQAVTLRCTFPKTQIWDLGAYSVSWDKLKRTGQEQDQNDKFFRGRVSGNRHSLFEGLAYEIITNISTQDFGKYWCLIQVKRQGIDYKIITLSVIRSSRNRREISHG
uniref:Ig-like domain-containing protein n=1 Tax=Amazona collaria TaxID=241587 RepID=A0A8B9FUF4_9PSIT